MQTNRHIVQTTMSHTGTFVIVEVKDLPFNGTVKSRRAPSKRKSTLVASIPSFHNPVEEANASIYRLYNAMGKISKPKIYETELTMLKL